MEEKKTIEVVACILIHNNLILATQRGYGEHKDKWEFPGGPWNNAPTEWRERPILFPIVLGLQQVMLLWRNFCNTFCYPILRYFKRYFGYNLLLVRYSV